MYSQQYQPYNAGGYGAAANLYGGGGASAMPTYNPVGYAAGGNAYYSALQQQQQQPMAQQMPQMQYPSTTARPTGLGAPAMNMYGSSPYGAMESYPQNYGMGADATAFPSQFQFAAPSNIAAAAPMPSTPAGAGSGSIQQGSLQRPGPPMMAPQAPLGMAPAMQGPDPDDDPNRLPTFVKVRGLPAEHDPRIVRRPGQKKARKKAACCA